MDAQQAPKTSEDVSSTGAAVIITGGDGVDEYVVDRLPAEAYIVAADGGLDSALRYGVHPDIIIGDLDSVSPEALDMTDAAVSVFPTDKDETDLALAIEHVLGRSPALIVIAGGSGQRLSHLLGNVAAIVDAATHTDVRWESGHTTIFVATPKRHVVVKGEPHQLVSLLPHGGSVDGVETTGLRWALAAETLTSTTTRGVSNEMTGDTATISVASGTLVVIHERIRT